MITPYVIAALTREAILVELKRQTNTYNDVADIVFNHVFELSSQMLIEMGTDGTDCYRPG